MDMAEEENKYIELVMGKDGIQKMDFKMAGNGRLHFQKKGGGSSMEETEKSTQLNNNHSLCNQAQIQVGKSGPFQGK